MVRFGSSLRVCALVRDKLSAMITKFVEDVKAGRHASEGWPGTCYGMSKLALIAYTKVMERPSVTF